MESFRKLCDTTYILKLFEVALQVAEIKQRKLHISQVFIFPSQTGLKSRYNALYPFVVFPHLLVCSNLFSYILPNEKGK